MPQTVTISHFLVEPALSPVGEALLIGVMLSDGRAGWSICGEPEEATVEDVRSLIAPLLEGRAIFAAAELTADVDTVRQKVTVSQKASQTAVGYHGMSGGALSRRQLIGGFVGARTAEVERFVEVERPLPAALRLAISEALLRAAAMSANQSPAAYLSQMEAAGLPAAPLAVELQDESVDLVGLLRSGAVAVITLGVPKLRQVEAVGSQAQLLQGDVRRLKGWLSKAVPAARPAIHLNLQGAFSHLFDNDPGKILGALYGLEQAAKPYSLVVENAVVADVETAAEIMLRLRSYIKARKMTTRLAAGWSRYTAAELELLASKGAVDLVHLDLSRWGGVWQALGFARACAAGGIALILHAAAEQADTAVAMATAGGAEALSGAVPALYSERVKLHAQQRNAISLE